MMPRRFWIGIMLGVSVIALGCGETPLPEMVRLNHKDVMGICHDNEILIFSNSEWREDESCGDFCGLACDYVCNEDTDVDEKNM